MNNKARFAVYTVQKARPDSTVYTDDLSFISDYETLDHKKNAIERARMIYKNSRGLFFVRVIRADGSLRWSSESHT